MASVDAHAGAEVLETDASPKIKRIYDDFKLAFRVPFVDVVFRSLASHPDYLELAWRQLHPNVQTVYFERQADQIRAEAARGTAHVGAPPKPGDEAAAVLRVFHYVEPKMLIAVAALRTATTGSLPLLRLLPTEEKRQIVPGVPADMPTIQLLSTEVGDEAVDSTFAEISASLGSVDSAYRALAEWPEYLGWAWQSTRTVAHSSAYRKLTVSLRRMADEAVLAFPFRVDCSPHTLRLCGMSETDIDGVRDTLDRAYRVLPGLVADIAFLSVGAEGEYASQRSPYPLQPQ